MEQAQEIDLQLCYPAERARPIDTKAVKALAASIQDCGLRSPITVRRCQKSRAGIMSDAFEVIAGMHRVKAYRWLQRATIPAFVVEADDIDAELMLIDENLCRNDLSPAERSIAMARRKKLYLLKHPETAHGGDRKLKSSGQVGHLNDADKPADSYAQKTAEATNASERTVRREVQRGEKLGADVLAKVARTSLDTGEELDALMKLPSKKREELAERAAAGEKVSAKTTAKKEKREQREAELGKAIAENNLKLPETKFYGVILADPEWRFEPYSRETGMDRAPENHYPTSTTDVIAARPVAEIAADDCVLFLWATVPMLPDALRVMAAWGFKYKSHLMWDKMGESTGYWFRNMHELLLVGTRGYVPAPVPGTQWGSVVQSPRRAHSEKPDWQYELIEAYFPTLPKIELNARRARPGWDSWGLDAPSLPQQEAAE